MRKTIAILVIVVMLMTACGGPSASGNQSTGGGITLEMFNTVETGMTHREVSDILGSSGTVVSEVDLGLGSQHVTIMRQWSGRGLGANAQIMFQGGRVISKAQVGLR